jgi:hypothetical protein
MFSVTGGVAGVVVLLELLVAVPVAPDDVCVTPGLISNCLPMPARRRGLLNRR